MPLEEQHLGPALSDAVDAYRFEAGPLLEGGRRRGLRMRRRRRITLACGTVLAVALAGTGLSYGVDALRHPTVTASPAAAPAGVSGREIAELLTGLMPHGEITEMRATGAGGGRPTLIEPDVQAVFDDGRGPARIDFSVVRANIAPTDPRAACRTTSASYQCTRTIRPDGSSLSLTRQSGGPGEPGNVLRAADLITPSGYEIRLYEFNSGTAAVPPPDRYPLVGVSDVPPPPITRPEPPLSAAQLSAVVTDPGWNRLLAAMRSARPDHQLAPAQVAAIAKPLLPKYATPGNAANQEGLTAFNLGNAGKEISILALRWPGKEARSEVVATSYSDARRLPDGTLIHTEQQKNTMLVRALHPDGMSVEVSQDILDPNATTTGPLTTAQLQAIAVDPAWDRPAPAPSATPTAKR